MKANDGTGNNEERDDWETPKELFRILNNQYRFTFDCCATNDNKKTKFYSEDFLDVKKENIKHWSCWMNPPFSKAREMFEHFVKVVGRGVAIYRCDNLETKIYQEVILPSASWIFIPKGRIVYQYNPSLRGGKGTRFPSALIGFNVPPPIELEGVILEVKNGKD